MKSFMAKSNYTRDNVPEDVWRSAEGLENLWCDMNGYETMFDLFIKGIMEERERCAKIAAEEADFRFRNDDRYPAVRVHDYIVVARKIEKSIRGT